MVSYLSFFVLQHVNFQSSYSDDQVFFVCTYVNLHWRRDVMDTVRKRKFQYIEFVVHAVSSRAIISKIDFQTFVSIVLETDNRPYTLYDDNSA